MIIAAVSLPQRHAPFARVKESVHERRQSYRSARSVVRFVRVVREGTPAARRGLFAAWLGWLLDGFDVMLYALVISALLGDFSMTKRTAGLLGSLTLVASGLAASCSA